MVALKILPEEFDQDVKFALRFTREARTLAKLSHPNIVSVYEFSQVARFDASDTSFVERSLQQDRRHRRHPQQIARGRRRTAHDGPSFARQFVQLSVAPADFDDMVAKLAPGKPCQLPCSDLQPERSPGTTEGLDFLRRRCRCLEVAGTVGISQAERKVIFVIRPNTLRSPF